MFRVGDLVTGLPENGYGCTSDRSLCVVDELKGSKNMYVSVLCHADGAYMDCNHTEVSKNAFTLCTYEEFMDRYPEAEFVSGHSINEIKNIKDGGKEMELRMNKEAIGSYVLTTEERETLRSEIITLLEEYDYNPTEYAVNKILDEWVKNKGWMINLFKKHPNYNGKFQIVFDSDYYRVTNKDELYNFADWMYYQSKGMFLEEVQIGKFSYSEVTKIYQKLDSVVDYMINIDSIGYKNFSVNGRNLDQMRKERALWLDRYYAYKYDDKIYITGGRAFNREKYKLGQNVCDFKENLPRCTEHIADEEFANMVNRLFPSVKAVAGQKVSRIVNKVCKLTGIDKLPEYNREFAKYADAINPLVIKRHTVLSCHPVDYLTMSFGNSWASCHTIDKENKRDMPDNYSGCYSSGTLSYMLDGSSFVYYTVDKDYNGNELELQDKINRNMFHMGEDKLIQARVYPQSTDGEGGIYKQIREIAQKVIADCLEVPNMWINSKGTGACSSVTRSYGTHYKDYTNYSDCNVSFLKCGEDNSYKNVNTIAIGHEPICPKCGDSHDYEEAIECRGCYKGEHKCDDCGCTYDEEDMYLIDGSWYCSDSSFYCDYHERREIGNYTYIQDYGYVCDDALESDDFYYCNHCDEWHYAPSRSPIVTTDDKHFCSERCAEREDYVLYNDKWYPMDELYYCEHCGQDVLEENWNHELNCCTDCEEEVKAELETEHEEELQEVV